MSNIMIAERTDHNIAFSDALFEIVRSAPTELLDGVRDTALPDAWLSVAVPEQREKALRLFLVELARRALDWAKYGSPHPKRCLRSLEVAEQYARGEASIHDLRAACWQAFKSWESWYDLSELHETVGAFARILVIQACEDNVVEGLATVVEHIKTYRRQLQDYGAWRTRYWADQAAEDARRPHTQTGDCSPDCD